MKPRQKKKPVVETTKWNIVRGDMVAVTQGPQAGQQGKVLAVLRSKNRLLIDNVNMVCVIRCAVLYNCYTRHAITVVCVCGITEASDCSVTERWLSPQDTG